MWHESSPHPDTKKLEAAELEVERLTRELAAIKLAGDDRARTAVADANERLRASFRQILAEELGLDPAVHNDVHRMLRIVREHRTALVKIATLAGVPK